MKSLFYCILLIVSFGFSSCVSDLPYDDQNEIIPVVNCTLSNDSIQKLSLTSSVKVNSSYIFKEIKDADISLSENNKLIGKFVRVGYNNWEIKYFPKPGQNYQLQIVLNDGKIITASTTMPIRNNISQISTEDKFPSKNFTQYTFELPTWIVIIQSDSMLLPKSKPTKKDIVKNEIGTNHPLADKFNINGNMVSFIPKADTPKYFFYIRIQSDTIVNNLAIAFKLQTNFEYHTFICFRTASAEYDNYIKSSFQKVLMRLDEENPVIWFDESKVFSNITNGTGIFAAYSDQYFNYNDDNSWY